ncbi:PstS family phosphate ABC transporter substrate-binding protein [Frigoribacterium sp. ACAM 257]|uniref:PstS family phosphate ABC transporter substrate-binding protein n=1 Tax=Frigoribacterium sp. ACAM 257 TaxID=2508998 RepID=UPI001CB908F1|nr:PstS family phosphate ABC transporter substrate-binding protein [Frigoribacterium sp. ACAM 257]
MRTRSPKIISLLAVVASAGLLLTGCGGQSSEGSEDGTSGTVTVDGSSTVAPLSEAAADLFRSEQSDVNVTVATSGTGGGFAKFCAGETDLQDASRPIEDDEIAACEAAGIDYTEIIIANDGLSVVVNPENDWAECLTTEQLATMWGPDAEGTITNWNQIDPSFPDQELSLFGAGTDSGTFDYFTDAINGEEGAIRTDYSPSEDDNITVQGVSGDTGAVGFFGLSYVEQNSDSVKAVAVDNGSGCVSPTAETVQDGTYAPLGRGLYVYVANASYTDKPQVKSFVDYYVENASQVAEDALFIGLTDEQLTTAQDELASLAS